MKIGIVGDLHIHAYKRFGIDSDLKLSKRLVDQIRILDQIEKIFSSNGVSSCIFGGDILHKSSELSTECLNILNNFFTNLNNANIKIHAVIGNHDLSVLSTPEWFNITTKIFQSVDISSECGNNIKLINYYDEVDYEKIKGYELVIAHKMPKGSQSNGYVFEDGVDWKILAKNNELVLFAHNHTKQNLSENCLVLGGVMHFDFGDSGDRGIYIYDTETKKLEFIKLNYPEFITVEDKIQIKHDTNYYRLRGSNIKIDDENVITEIEPIFFDERIKSDNFAEILDEWIKLNDKDLNILNPIKKLLSERINNIGNLFKGRVYKISGLNFLSYETFSVDIPKGFIIVKGLNGSGKSTIIGEALFWCLFGETTKGLTGDDVIRNRPELQKDCLVEIRLTDNLKVSRSRKDGLRVFHNEIELTKGLRAIDRQDRLCEILGFDKSIFLSSCYFSQEGLITLTGLSDTDKTDMITNLLGFDQYDDLYNKVFAEEKILNTNISILNNDIVNIKHEIDKLDDRVSSIDTDIKLANKTELDARLKIQDLNKDIEDLNKSKEFMRQRIDSNVIEIKEHTKDIEDISEKEESVSIDIKILEKTLIKIKEDRESLLIKCNNANNEIKTMEKDIKLIESELFNISNLFVGVECNKCKSIITNEHKENHIKDLNNKLNDKKDELLILISNYRSIDKEFELKNREYSAVNTEINTYRQTLNTLINERIKLIEEDKIREKMRFQYLTEEQTIDNKIHNKELEIKFQNETIDKLKKVIEDKTINSNELQSKKIIEKEKQLSKENDILQLNSTIDDLNFWKIAFSSKGIRSVLLDRFCNQFNKILVKYISNISNGNIQVILTPTKLTKGGEERNKIGLDIIIDGCKSSYSMLSGGEKARVNTSICLSLNRWISERYHLENGLLGLIVLDELFGSVDPEGEEALARQIVEESRNKSIFVISHTVELGSWADVTWNVIKKDKISQLVL